MHIIFLVDAFPVISETFILNQITGLIDLGHRVSILSAARSNETVVHSDVNAYGLLKQTYYHNDKPANRLVRFLKAIKLALMPGCRHPKAVFNSLNFLKYGREAASLNYFYKLMFFLRAGKADIIHCHFGTNGNLGAVMKEIGVKAKVVTTFHGYDIRRGMDSKGSIYQQVFRRGDCFLSISDHNYKHLIAFGADPARIRTHPAGIDLERYACDERSYDFAREPVRIITVGRLVPEKGLAYGIGAIARLVQEKSLANIEYTIIGDGPLRETLETRVERLGLKDKIHFAGSVTQEGVIEALRRSHIFFLPSNAEALPVSLMEAQAMEVPVVATDVGSVCRVIAPAESGFLVPAQDTAAMAERLEFLVRHPFVCRTMGEAGRKHVEEHYDIRKLNRRLIELYQELLDDQR